MRRAALIIWPGGVMFLQGFLRKDGARWWFFDGVIVVECMVNVVKKQLFIARQKYVTYLGFIYRTSG
jgi:hypothetical protein